MLIGSHLESFKFGLHALHFDTFLITGILCGHSVLQFPSHELLLSRQVVQVGPFPDGLARLVVIIAAFFTVGAVGAVSGAPNTGDGGRPLQAGSALHSLDALGLVDDVLEIFGRYATIDQHIVRDDDNLLLVFVGGSCWCYRRCRVRTNGDRLGRRTRTNLDGGLYHGDLSGKSLYSASFLYL